MPLSEFKCQCGNLFEKIQSRSTFDSSVTAICPRCGQYARRILSRTGSPQFVGSGFYATDYQHKS